MGLREKKKQKKKKKRFHANDMRRKKQCGNAEGNRNSRNGTTTQRNKRVQEIRERNLG